MKVHSSRSLVVALLFPLHPLRARAGTAAGSKQSKRASRVGRSGALSDIDDVLEIESNTTRVAVMLVMRAVQDDDARTV